MGDCFLMKENETEPPFASVVSSLGAPVAIALELTATLLPKPMSPVALRARLDPSMISLNSQSSLLP